MSDNPGHQSSEIVSMAAVEPEAQTTAPAAQPSRCENCEAAADRGRSLVYALGEIGYEFSNQARRDSLKQQMAGNPEEAAHLLEYFAKNPWDAGAVTWTLKLDATPVYAIVPGGPFAAFCFERLREFLADQLQGKAERVSVAGVVAGETQLAGGHSLPILWPEMRGMYSWTTAALMAQVQNKNPSAVGEVGNFLERVYYELRNLGITPQDRALNFAATNAFQIEKVYELALGADLQLDSIAVERSPMCRPESDCWDVKLIFFHPTKRMEQARQVYRFTVDVSDVVPVTIGKVRHWRVY